MNITANFDAVCVSSFFTESISSFLVYLGSNMISWKIKKEKVAALSSTEYEEIPATETTSKIM